MRFASARLSRLACAAGTSVLLASGTAHAALINYQNFNDLSAFTLNGATGSINTGGQGVVGPNPGDERVLRLTNNFNQAGSAFLTNSFSLAADASFSAYFEFQISNARNSGADGLVFAVQTQSNTAGGIGGGIGYQGITPSVGIEFDTWDNTIDSIADGNSANHIGINLNGSVNSVQRASLGAPNLDSGVIFHAWVDYNGATDDLEVRFAQTDTRPALALLSHSVDLETLLGTTDAYIGFTSGTGFAAADHDIRRLVFTGSFDPIIDPDQPGAVPEPSPLALIALGLAALVCRRWRTKTPA